MPLQPKEKGGIFLLSTEILWDILIIVLDDAQEYLSWEYCSSLNPKHKWYTRYTTSEYVHPSICLFSVAQYTDHHIVCWNIILEDANATDLWISYFRVLRPGML